MSNNQNNENDAPQSGGEQAEDLQNQDYQDDEDYEDNDGGQDEAPTKGSGKPVKRAGRRKINIEFIKDKSRRHITFSKRKAGIMKKAYELSTLTGTQVLLLVASETGHVYTFATPKLQPLITKTEGKNLIQACLNSPDPTPDSQQEEGTPINSSTPSQQQHSYHHQHEPLEDERKPKRIKTEKSAPTNNYNPPMAPTPTPPQNYPPTAPSPLPSSMQHFDIQAYAAQMSQNYPTHLNANYLQSLSQMGMPPTSMTPQPSMNVPTAPSPVPQRLPPNYSYPQATNPLQQMYGLSTPTAPNNQSPHQKLTIQSQQPPLPTLPGHAFVNPNAYHIPSMHSAPSPAPQHDYQKQ